MMLEVLLVSIFMSLPLESEHNIIGGEVMMSILLLGLKANTGRRRGSRG